MNALAMFFVKLGRSPWEERFERFSGFLLKALFTLGCLWALLNINTLTDIYRGIPS